MALMHSTCIPVLCCQSAQLLFKMPADWQLRDTSTTLMTNCCRYHFGCQSVAISHFVFICSHLLTAYLEIAQLTGHSGQFLT